MTTRDKIKSIDWSGYSFAPIVKIKGKLHYVDLSQGYNPDFLKSLDWGIGGYNEHRPNMYLADHFDGERCIHMGVDIWTPSHTDFYAFWNGEIAYLANNDRKGDYGPTIITSHTINKQKIFALHGHLTKDSLADKSVGQRIEKGEKLGSIGSEKENGGWAPHLHFQLSVNDPGEADMPGVVAPKDRDEALHTFPDPAPIMEALS